MTAEFDSLIRKFGKVHSGAILKENHSVTPLNLAEAVLSAALELSRSRTKLAPKSNWLKDKHLLRASTGGTNTKKALTERIHRAKELLTGAKPEPK